MKAADRDLLLGEINERTKTIEEDVKQHNGQIRALQMWQARFMGGCTVMGVVVVLAQSDIRQFVVGLVGG